MSNEIDSLKAIAKEIRISILQMCHASKSSHLGGALSIVEGLVSIYFTNFFKFDTQSILNGDSDMLIFGKGHASTALYSILARKNVIPSQDLLQYKTNGHKLTEHPSVKSYPGVDWATGSLGHALSLGTGVAFGYKLQHHHRNTLVILSDGDCQEGSTWEAAMLSSKLGLDNLYCFVDANQFQATGRVEEITNLYPIAKKFESFGWKAVEVNGNNFHQVLPEIEKMKIIKGTPKALILNTVKGSGVPFMENNNNWHYKFPDDYELNLAIEQIKNAK